MPELELYSYTHVQENPSDKYFINVLDYSKEFCNVSILFFYLLGVPVGLGLMPLKTQQEAPSVY